MNTRDIAAFVVRAEKGLNSTVEDVDKLERTLHGFTNSEDHHIYHCIASKRQEELLDELGARIAKVAGVTISGNRLTIRWNDPSGDLVQVHCAILEVG